MTLTTVVLVVLAVWSIVMLVTFDKVTSRPRRAVRTWLAGRRHRTRHMNSLRGSCVCGWEVQVHGTTIREDDEVEMLPVDVDVPAAVAERLDAHIDTARLVDKGLLAYLLSCAYCVAMWAAAPVAASAVLWADNRVWQAAMLALGARPAAGLLAAHFTPPDEAEDELVD